MNVLLTYSAPAERASAAEVAADHQKLLQEPLVHQLLDSLPEPAMILNPQRQVVLANRKLAALLSAEPEQLLGRRPGEILTCIHSQDGAGGCGTSKFCAQCGAAGAIWESQTTNTAQVRQCTMTCATGEGSLSLDLKVWATPLAVSGRFTVFAVRDKGNA
ncbi:MAG TPA: PAS domain-containing protein [Terracidiphilus sp.]|nr:PAS domain-containing protein [Terracidiphilus sp.]